MKGQVLVSFAEKKGRLNVEIRGNGDNLLILNIIKRLRRLAKHIKNSMVGKRGRLLAAMLLYNLGKQITEDNENAAKKYIAIFNDVLDQVKS